jgi:Pao retrotransposon peptidase
MSIEKIEIPRLIAFKKTLELFGFCYACEKAYAAAIYAKVIDQNLNPKLRLIIAKSKVTPIKKPQTIPRLELCAAHLLSKLAKYTLTTLEIENKNIVIRYFTDSTITLVWIKGNLHRWKQFVASRVTTIHENTDEKNWFHIKSADNPADCASRGIPAAKLVNFSLWWEGPASFFERRWEDQNLYETEMEAKLNFEKKYTFVTLVSDWSKFSNFTTLIRVVAYCRRILKIQNKKTKYLSAVELNQAEMILAKLTQEQFKNTKQMSKIISLNPSLDENGLLRVGGRLQKSLLP